MAETSELLIEAGSLEEAKQQVKDKLPEDFYVLSEKILSDGTTKTINFTGKTVKGAFLKVENIIPSDAKILDKKEMGKAGKRIVEVKAFDKHKAKQLIKQQLFQYEIIEAIELNEKGSRGFLGIGRKPDNYAGSVFLPAVVEITYIEPAKIQVKMKKRPSESEFINSLDDLERQTSEKWLQLDKPVKGEVVALMVMQAAFQFLSDKVSAPFNILLNEAKVLYEENENIKQLAPLQLGPPERNYDVNDIPLVSQQFKEAITMMRQLRESIPRFAAESPTSEKTVDSQEIFESVSSGDLPSLNRLLERDINLVNACGLKGMTPLHMAATRCQQSVARLLLDKGANVNARKDDGWTPLHHASQNGDVALVTILLDHGGDPNIRSRGGQTTLHTAAYGVTETTIKTLENEWALSRRQDRPDLDPESVVMLLIKHGADIDATEPKHGAAPLHLAIFRGQRGAVRALLACDADPNAMSKGWTPLHIAAGRCDEDIIRMLLEKGANINALDNKGRIPRQVIGMASESCDPIIRANVEKLLTPSK